MARYNDYQNKKNYGGNMYHAAASAPSLDITINHNGAGSPSSYGRRPPMSAPPPPPTYHSSNSNDYEPLWFDRFVRRENRGMFRLCLVQTLLSAVIMAGGIWCYNDTPAYCPYYSAIWTSSIFLLNALVGTTAAKIGSLNLYVAHLILSLISIMMCAVSSGLSARNWNLVGTYNHPKLGRNAAFCLIGQHDAPRISHIFSNMDKYDFGQCLFELKVGVAVNSVQFVVSCIIAFLNMISVFLCMKRTCTSCL